MENNFFVGVVVHTRGSYRDSIREKIILYTEDNLNFVDLLKGISYSLDSGDKDYVLKDSLIETDISEYRTDYLYLLSKYKEVGKKNIKKRRFFWPFLR